MNILLVPSFSSYAEYTVFGSVYFRESAPLVTEWRCWSPCSATTAATRCSSRWLPLTARRRTRAPLRKSGWPERVSQSAAGLRVRVLNNSSDCNAVKSVMNDRDSVCPNSRGSFSTPYYGNRVVQNTSTENVLFNEGDLFLSLVLIHNLKRIWRMCARVKN